MPNYDDIVPAEWADSYEVEKNEVCESVHATISAGVWVFFVLVGGSVQFLVLSFSLVFFPLFHTNENLN